MRISLALLSIKTISALFIDFQEFIYAKCSHPLEFDWQCLSTGCFVFWLTKEAKSSFLMIWLVDKECWEFLSCCQTFWRSAINRSIIGKTDLRAFQRCALQLNTYVSLPGNKTLNKVWSSGFGLYFKLLVVVFSALIYQLSKTRHQTLCTKEATAV